MPRITAITATRRNPGRVAVFLDGEFAAAADAGLVLELGWRVGDEIDADRLAGLADGDTIRRAITAGLDALAVRPRGVAELRLRLRRRGFEPEAVEAAITRLGELGYLDDRAFATFWIENRRQHRPRSARLITAELRQKGVSTESIDLGDWDEAEAARDAAERWLRGHRGGDPATRERRLGQFLSRRGFGHSAIRAILRRLESPVEGERLA